MTYVHGESSIAEQLAKQLHTCNKG